MFKKIWELLIWIQTCLGRPVRLQKLLKKHPELSADIGPRSQSISAEAVAKWQNWGQLALRYADFTPVHLLGWRMKGGRYCRSVISRDVLSQLVSCTEQPDWQTDIQKVTGLASSKSNLHAFFSLDQMVLTQAPELVDEISQMRLQTLLAHDELSAMRKANRTDFFVRYLWDERLFLMNDGGSHHFAAAQFVAKQLQQPVILQGVLYVYAIDEDVLNALRRDFDIFGFAAEDTLFCYFLNAMDSFAANFYWLALPPPYVDMPAIFLPKSNWRSRRASHELTKAGIFDIGEHLTACVNKQRTF
jgi:hypothetical protein